jgi:hypothetical protein
MGLTYLEDIQVVDAPRLERLFQSTTFSEHGGKGKLGRSMIKIGHAPSLLMLGYFGPGNNQIEITKTVTVVRT